MPMDDPRKQAYLKQQYDENEYCRGYGWGCYKLECQHCKKTFYAMYPYAKWCSYRCRNDAGILRRKEQRKKARHKVCLECKVAFVGTRNDAKYCSHTCRQLAYKRRIQVEELLPQPAPVNKPELTDKARGKNDPLHYRQPVCHL